MRVHRILLAFSLSLASACQSDAPGPVAPGPAAREPIDVNVSPGGEATLMPQTSRARRRMNIDQLDASIRRATGGLGWEANGRNLFADLAATLGKPDYVERTREELEPSAIFQKFLDDAARSVCDRLVREEKARRREDRVLFRHVAPGARLADDPSDVDANLRAAILRFHGRKLDAGAPALEGWRWLYQSALHVSRDTETAWRTVCVGLLTHPDFYTY